MRAVLQSLNTPDAPSPETFVPPSGQEAWAMLVQAMIGADDGPGSELFQITVCTPAWIAERLDEGWPPFDGRGHLIVATYDWPLIERTLRARVERLEAPTWHELALKLSRLGHWEFEDYVESKGVAG